MGWNDERIEQLKCLWNEGLTASQVASRLGGGVSRNAVISKVHRLQLPTRPNAPRGRRPGSISRTRILRVRMPEPPVVPEDPMMLEDGSFATLLTIDDRMCRWPIGDPSHNAFHFCGRKPMSGSSYCEGHTHKARQPRVRRARAACN